MNAIGRYQLVEKLGQGGMGVVYRAFDPLLQRVVAVKLIGNLEAGDEVRERFFREARAAGQLSHKNIITIHDLGEHEGQPFLAMEYLEGEDLQHRMASKTPMSIARKLELAIEICEAVEYAHDHGVIHRDIKPANIFLTSAGRVKILDFGLARLITSELTNSNMMMGTLNYMAPEQVRGERADHRSDIFSTGVVLYELFGGRKAFEGESFGATLYKILEEVPAPLRSLDANLPPELEAVVERALEKPRDARYPHMSDMLRDLTTYRQRLMVTNSPSLGGFESQVAPVPSDAPRPPLTPLTPISGVRSDVQPLAHDAPTLAATPAPALSPQPVSAPGSTPGSTPGTAAPAPAASRRLPLVAAAAAAVLLGALTMWLLTRDRDPVAPAPAAQTTTAANQKEIASQLEQASKALQSGDGAAAQRHADAVLAMSPNHPEARRLRDQAQRASETVGRSLSSARELLDAGRFEEASRAAGEALSVDPSNAEARRLMDEASARSRGKGVEEARTRMTSAKNAAIGAAAPKLASAPYNAAAAAEREAASLTKRGRLADATTKYWEASGLFRSAEIAAQTEAAARAERARAQVDQKALEKRAQEPPAPPAQPKPAPSAQPLPSVPATPGLPSAPLASPVPTPSAPTPPPPKEPAPQPEAPAQPPPTAAIAELVDRYRSALESRNIDALKRLWPGLGGSQESAIRMDFQNSKRINVDIVSPQISVNGDSGTVRFVRRYELNTIDGQRAYSESNVTMTVRRVGQAWTIAQLQFAPIR